MFGALYMYIFVAAPEFQYYLNFLLSICLLKSSAWEVWPTFNFSNCNILVGQSKIFKRCKADFWMEFSSLVWYVIQYARWMKINLYCKFFQYTRWPFLHVRNHIRTTKFMQHCILQNYLSLIMDRVIFNFLW